MEQINVTDEEMPNTSDDELHAQAVHYINESNQLLFQALPKVISQIITKKVWKSRDSTYKNFGEYALKQAPHGLGITNNDMLWLLKSAMVKQNDTPAHWAEVLDEVDNNVRVYAKEKKIPINDLTGNLTDFESTKLILNEDNVITYLPSRSNSNDGQLLKLKKKDPEAYEEVIHGKIKLKEAWPQMPRKKVHPIESVKNKFTGLSKEDREAFLAWIEAEKENWV